MRASPFALTRCPLLPDVIAMAECPPPIFIVGAPRSGTTLLATLLSSHSQISCGAETHFFPYLEANHQQIPLILRDPAWPRQATEFMAALSLQDHRVHDLFGVEQQAIFDYLKSRRPSVQALLESLTVQQMVATQKSRWAEKTPNHILHLESIRRLYPAAKIVRIVRDPRDSAISMATKLPWASNSPLDNAYLIDEWYRKSQPFLGQDNLAYTVKYEALVAQPETSLQKLCGFLGMPFEPAMLDTEAAAQHTAPHHETWKSRVGQKLDASRCFAWKNRQPDIFLKAISLVCQGMIRQFNYSPLDSTLEPIYAHYVSYRFVQWSGNAPGEPSYSQQIAQLLDQQHLLVPCDPAILPADGIVYCDIPIGGHNLGRSLRRFARFCADLVSLRLRGKTIRFTQFCLNPLPERNRFGKAAGALLKVVGSKTQLVDLVEDTAVTGQKRDQHGFHIHAGDLPNP
jgi:hypothetical protein